MLQREQLCEAERRKLNRLVQHIYALFRGEKPWKVKLQRIRDNPPVITKYGLNQYTIGYCFEPERLVSIDFRAGTLDIFVHECLHAAFPNKKEAEVEMLEEFVMKNMSPIQAKRLLRIMAENIV